MGVLIFYEFPTDLVRISYGFSKDFVRIFYEFRTDFTRGRIRPAYLAKKQHTLQPSSRARAATSATVVSPPRERMLCGHWFGPWEPTQPQAGGMAQVEAGGVPMRVSVTFSDWFHSCSGAQMSLWRSSLSPRVVVSVTQ